eukprot:4212789-Lingulodinium_polyedra.AAC.1
MIFKPSARSPSAPSQDISVAILTQKLHRRTAPPVPTVLDGSAVLERSNGCPVLDGSAVLDGSTVLRGSNGCTVRRWLHRARWQRRARWLHLARG